MNHLKSIFVIFLTYIMLMACKSTATQKVGIHPKGDELMAGIISQMYAEDAVKILENGEILTGREQIKEYFFQHSLLTPTQSDTVIMANQARGLTYEIGEFVDANNDPHKGLIIWQTKDTTRQRVFEFMAKMDKADQDLSELDERRALWMKLCNAHQVTELVNELYSPNTLYFNHKPLVQGRESLIKEYQYMNYEQYSLTLTPIIIEIANSDFIFEIGQCQQGYNGKYILIWQKDKSGKWYVFIDSNI